MQQLMIKQYGFSLVEAMVATAIMGIGIVGVFGLVSISTNTNYVSVSNYTMQLQANQILEIIEIDRANIDQYTLDLTNCVAPAVGETEMYQVRPFEWCQRLNDLVGAASATDIRSVTVTTPPDDSRVVHITLQCCGGEAEISMKRTFDSGG